MAGWVVRFATLLPVHLLGAAYSIVPSILIFTVSCVFATAHPALGALGRASPGGPASHRLQ